ncbi:universal stress protein [Catelliglobosispora koreensis]|uniref:universal stress protein n=1 Tax=Catelliglobosispora koreensis TaxID=129052 RepID=UPI0003730149|nr:universal stress protein [Catelliglobosispora koreensis]
MNTRNYVIAVGVDGSDNARQALLWAVREAHARGGTVQAINAWRWQYPELRDKDTAVRETRRAEQLLAREVASLPSYLRTGVSVACEAIEGDAAAVLTEAGRTADVLVLGSHGSSRHIHQLLGSVSEDCIRQATCPVVVIPANYQNPAVRDTAGQQINVA